MSDIDLTGLQALRSGGETKAAKARAKKPPWAPLDLTTLQPGTYLACDQSIKACGVVLFEVMPERDRWAVHMAQKIVGGESANPAEALESAVRLHALIYSYVAQWVSGTDWGHVRAVHEHPPVGGGSIRHPESSYLGSLAFRLATAHIPLLPMVRKQDHALLICGNRYADKREHHAQLKLLFDRIDGSELVTNEAMRDALSIALFAAKRGY
jgi:hypothetical protein